VSTNVAPLTGTATINNTSPKTGDTLTAALASGNNTGILSYQWKADGANIGTNASTYTVATADLGKAITVVITSSVETGSVTSAVTSAVVKKAAPATPAAPTLASKTHNSITLNAVAGCEYSMDGTTWQPSNTFSGLSASTAYTFYQRIAETADTLPSASSLVFNVSTDVAPPDALTGTAAIDNLSPKIGDTLTASLSSTNNTGTLSYQWKANGANVGTNASTYVVAATDFGKAITVVITSSIETGSVTSAGTSAVVKKVAPAAPAAPTLASKTHNSVTLVAVAGCEYSKDGTTWQASNTFNGLSSSTAYTFYQRKAETADTLPSASSPVFNVTTAVAPLTGTATINNTSPKIGDTLTASLASGNNTGTLSYQWKAGGTNVGTNASTYTVTTADLGKAITVVITSSVETGSVTSAATSAVVKKTGPAAPAAPTLSSKTYNSVTLVAVAGCEYSKDGTTWQASNTFSGLSSSTAYNFYQRIAATADTQASLASPAFNVSTNVAPLTGTATINNT
jgi:gamma-glutamyl phosphate reductase